MTTPPAAPAPVNPEAVEDDPAKPYKAIAATAAPGVVAFLGALLDLGDDMPGWLRILLLALSAGAGAYVVSNPKRRKRRKVRKGEAGIAAERALIIALLALAVVFLVLVLWNVVDSPR